MFIFFKILYYIIYQVCDIVLSNNSELLTLQMVLKGTLCA